MKAPPTLARRLGVAVIWMMVCAVVFIATASLGIDVLIQYEVKSRLPENLVQALDLLEQNRVPASDDMLALMKTMTAEQPRALLLSYTGMALLSLLVIAICVWLTGRIARRVTDPIYAVAEGAGKIAAGDFSHRISPPAKLTREVSVLVDAFNAQAEALDRSESRMRFQTAAVAHELRTPLTVLRGYIHGALDGVFPRDDAQMRALLTQVEDLSRIIEDLRTVSLASSGALILDVTRCDLAAETLCVLDVMSPQLRDAGFAVETDLAPVIAWADPARVRQMLRAVLENARRYAAEGGKLQISVEGSTDQCVVTVSDRGPGFPDGHRAFEGFWRADLSRTRATGGSGLGLSVVKALADAQGCQVLLSNRRNGGARVEMRFMAA